MGFRDLKFIKQMGFGDEKRFNPQKDYALYEDR